MRIVLPGLLILLSGILSAQSKRSPKFDLENSRTDQQYDTLLFVVEDLENFRNLYPALNVIRSHDPSGTVQVRNVTQKFSVFLADTNILFIDIPQLPYEESFPGNPDFYANRIRTVQHQNTDLDGEGYVVSVKERRFDTSDIDLRHKLVPLGVASTTSSNHATDMATLISGVGNSLERNKGIVTSAQLSTSDFFNLLPDDEELLTANNIFTQNHSYGVIVENYYGAEARAYDQSVSDHPELLHVFSVGNEGENPPNNGIYLELPFSNLTGNFKQAKNILTVAALDPSYRVSNLNSRGPAYDGRLKPELTAYGGGGSSDAAAVVSGISVLLRERFFSRTGGLPNSALLKSILISGSEDVGLPGIDFYSGYGNVNAKKSLEIIDNDWWKVLDLDADTTISLNIPANTHALKLTVTWIDPPARINTNQTLINDIDAVLSNGGSQWLPWILQTERSVAALVSPPSRGEDHLNPTEFITLDRPDPGTYELSLAVNELRTESQEVFISWYLEPEDLFAWDTPILMDAFQAGSRQGLFWQTSFEGVATLEMRLGNEQWEVMETQLDLSEPYRWNVPDTSSMSQLKMIVNGSEFMSDPFLISEDPEIGVAYDCENELGLQWSALSGNVEYVVYEMGETLMNERSRVTDTVVSIPKSKSVHYAVAPVFDGVTGLRSRALNYTFQGSFCYFRFFSAQRNQEDEVTVVLSLSTNHDIERIDLLKSYNSLPEDTLASLTPGFSTDYQVSDRELDPGFMTYRAVLTFKDGTTLASAPTGIFIEKENRAILFPNPTSEDFINILSDGAGNRIQILDRGGKFLFEKELSVRTDFIIVRDLRSGLYLYRLLRGTKIIDTGSFIIQ